MENRRAVYHIPTALLVFAEERKVQANEEFSDEDWQNARSRQDLCANLFAGSG